MSVVERSAPSRAEAAIEAMRKRNPLVLRLAAAVSFAVIIDRALLRAARLELVPGADAGTEADLWFSSIIQSRTSDGLVLDRDVAEALRRRMSPAQVEEAWRVTAREHAALSPSLKIEEEIAYLSVSAESGARDEMVRKIQSVIRAMLSGNRPGLAQWAARALAMFPSAVRDLPETRMLDAGTRIRLGQGVSTAAEEPLPEWMSLVAPSGLKKTQLQVELRERELVLTASTGTSGKVIPVPDTNPLVIEVAWEAEKRPQARQVTLRRGETARIPVGADTVRLRTITGEEYVVREVAETSESLAAEVIDFSEEMARHKRFFGREEEIARLLQLTGRVIITGEHGIGKTALLCELIRRLAPAPVFVHFFSRGYPRLASIGAASRSLAAQIATRYRLDEAAMDLPLAQVLERLALSPRRPERLYIVIDDLQAMRGESHNEHFRPALTALLPSVPDFVTVYASHHAIALADLSITRMQLPPPDQKLLAAFTGNERMASLSEGNFGKAEVQVSLGEGSSPFSDVVAGLWRRWPAFVRLLAIVYRPLPNRVAGDVPKSLTPVLRMDSQGVVFLNRTLRNAVAKIVPATPEPHVELIRRLQSALDDDAVADCYTLYAPEHLLVADANDEAQRLVVDPTFMREVIRRHGVMVMRDHLRRVVKATEPTLEALPGVDLASVRLALEAFEANVDALLEQPDDLEAILAAYCSRDDLRLAPSRLVPEAAEREREALPPRRHAGPVTGCVRIDESHVATWSNDGTLMLWPREERSLAPRVVRFDAPITAYVQIGAAFAVAGDALGFLYVVRTDSAAQVSKIAAHNGAVAGAVVAAGSLLIATWSDDGVIRLGSMVTPGSTLDEVSDLTGHDDELTGCAFVGGARLLVSSSRDGTIRIWNVAERRTVRIIRNEVPIIAMTVSSDGRWLATIDEARRMRIELIEVTNSLGIVAPMLESPHGRPPAGITASRDDRYIATWDQSGMVALWSVPPPTGTRMAVVFLTDYRARSESRVLACAFVGAEPRLFVSWADGTAALINPGEDSFTMNTEGAVIRTVVDFGDHFCTGDDRGRLVEWSTSTGRVIRDYSKGPDRVDAVVAGPEVLVSDGEEEVRFDRSGGETVTLTQPRIAVRGDSAAVWSEQSGAVYAANLRTGILHNVTQGTEGLLSVCAVGAVSECTAVGHDDGSVLLFGSSIRVEPPHPVSRVTALAFIDDDKAIVAAYATGELTVSRSSGTLLVDADPETVATIEVDDRRQRFATVETDGTVRIRSISDHLGIIDIMEGGVDPRIRCRFSLDGKALIGAAPNHTIPIWYVDTGEERAVARGHRAPITGLAVGEGVIYSSSEDRTVRMWDVNTGEQLAVVYGYNAFRCIDARDDVIVAGDDAGEIWRFSRPGQPLGGMQVYISYSRSAPPDQKLAERLHAGLLERGVRTWFDQSGSSPGESSDGSNEDELRKSAALVVIASNHAYSSRRVQRELDAFQSRKDPTIFVLAVDRLERPFSKFPSIDLSNPRDPFAYARAFTELMNRLNERFGGNDVVTA